MQLTDLYAFLTVETDTLAIAFRGVGSQSSLLDRGHWKYFAGFSTRYLRKKFYSCPLDTSHLWAALRYTELCPVRSGSVPETVYCHCVINTIRFPVVALPDRAVPCVEMHCGVFMWKCECGEQIEDQFDACWRCAGRAASAPGLQTTKEPLAMECPRCKTGLEYLGKKRFHEGGHLTPVLLGDLFVNRETFDLYACSQCGHVEFFLEGIGEALRPKNILESNSTGDEQSPVSE